MGVIDWFNRFEQVGCSLRLGMEAQGSDQLVGCLDALLQLLPSCPPLLAQQLQQVLVQVLAAQERKDNILVADLLEYEIAPLVQSLEEMAHKGQRS